MSYSAILLRNSPISFNFTLHLSPLSECLEQASMPRLIEITHTTSHSHPSFWMGSMARSLQC